MEQAEDQISELNEVPKTANKKNPPKTDVSSVGGRSELGNLDGNLKNETSEQNSCGFHRDNTRPERLWSVLLATFIAAMGPLSFGYGIGYSSAAVTQLDIASAPPNSTELHLDYGGVTWFGVSENDLKTLSYLCITVGKTGRYNIFYVFGLKDHLQS